MDDQLKKDINEAFFDEYRKAEEANSHPVFKASRAVMDTADKIAGKAGMNAGVFLILSVLAAVWAPPVGIPLLIGFAGSMVTSIVAMVKEGNRAQKAINADIDNGKLTARYHSVLDQKERELAETQDLYRAQRAQLPAKGAAAEAFAGAVAGGPAETAPAPAPAPSGSQPRP
ncbi:MAG: hypothetical protein ACAH80_09520 [Alphaproteobacteria bacterium]